jgi:hypothetical protein
VNSFLEDHGTLTLSKDIEACLSNEINNQLFQLLDLTINRSDPGNEKVFTNLFQMKSSILNLSLLLSLLQFL